MKPEPSDFCSCDHGTTVAAAWSFSDDTNGRRQLRRLSLEGGAQRKETEPNSVAGILCLQQRSGGHLLPAIHSGDGGGEFRSFLHGVQQLR
ncbi:hypothetical protein AAC387_Pa05g0744 [Persea americana]